jgi:hypothetical protein
MTRYNSWDEAARGALEHLCSFAAEISRDDNVVVPIFDGLGTLVRDMPDAIDRMTSLMERAGIAAIHIMSEREPFAIGEMHKLLVGKQHDYGHGNILHFGTVGVAVRLCDKIARLLNLTKRGGEAKHEALTDTYMDILGYAVIAIMLEEGSFELELEQDGK